MCGVRIFQMKRLVCAVSINEMIILKCKNKSKVFVHPLKACSGEWRFSSTHSKPQHEMIRQLSASHHVPLTPREETLVVIE
jgi:hypothetical protein